MECLSQEGSVFAETEGPHREERRFTGLKILIALIAALSMAVPVVADVRGMAVGQQYATRGFLTSLAFDREGVMYYTNRSGDIRRFVDQTDELVAHVPSADMGNSALLGMAFDPDGQIVVHYVSPDLMTDVISRVDPVTGEERIIAEIRCTEIPVNCSSEHRGGNPFVNRAGEIFVGVGDYNLQLVAQDPTSSGGKIYRISADGVVTKFAKGVRNPFDMVWDEEREVLILGDNGAVGHDELNVAAEGANLGWPLTMGSQPPVEGTVPPAYVFEGTVVPTGITLVGGAPSYFRGGVLVTAFSSERLYFFPSLDPITPPIVLVDRQAPMLIDVAIDPEGGVWFASPFVIYRLDVPLRGDVDGDGEIDFHDYQALILELDDGDGNSVFDVEGGTFPGTWGADADLDGIVSERDLQQLGWTLWGRRRGVGRH